MTIYCPSCGKPNTDEASNCISCGTELAKKKAARFKGTMMMSGPGALPGAPASAPPPAAPAAPPAAAPGASQPPAAKKDLAFQKTMLGPMTAPPGVGAPGAPAPAFGAPPAAAPPASGGFGAPPAAAPPAGGGFGTPPPAAAPPAGGGFGAPPPAAGGGGFGAPPAAAPPAGGGFGAPPPAAGGGGFGAPPPAAGGGGFGAPPPAAGGGFGAPPPAADGGGFGAPAAVSGFGATMPESSGGGGFGAPAGAPPGGGFGGDSPSNPPGGGGFGGAPVAATPDGGEKPKSKLPMILGGCCLLIVLFGCLFGGYWAWRAKQAASEFGGAFADGAGRLLFATHLGSIPQTCAADPTGASAQGSFNPAVFANYQSIVCQVPSEAAAIASDGNRSQITMSDDGRAAALGLPTADCFTLTAGQAKFVACGGLLIHIENPGQMQ